MDADLKRRRIDGSSPVIESDESHLLGKNVAKRRIVRTIFLQQAMRVLVFAPKSTGVAALLTIQCATGDGVRIDVSLRIFYKRKTGRVSGNEVDPHATNLMHNCTADSSDLIGVSNNSRW